MDKGRGKNPSGAGRAASAFPCALVGAASFDARHFICEDFSFVVAVDGGYASLSGIGARCDLALGDFDSLGFVPCDVPTLRCPAEKDDSDTAIALAWAREQGFAGAAVYGALGGRLDHTAASLQALVGAARAGMRACAVGEGMAVVALAGPSSLEVPARAQGTFSLLSASDRCTGVSELGAKYEIEGAALSNDVTLGLSNEFRGEPVRISLQTGVLLAFLPCMPLADISFAG